MQHIFSLSLDLDHTDQLISLWLLLPSSKTINFLVSESILCIHPPVLHQSIRVETWISWEESFGELWCCLPVLESHTKSCLNLLLISSTLSWFIEYDVTKKLRLPSKICYIKSVFDFANVPTFSCLYWIIFISYQVPVLW